MRKSYDKENGQLDVTQYGRLLPIDELQSGRSLRPECSTDAPCFLNAVYQNSTQVKKTQADVLQYGRSMIEMLGVLAIIGVLSVGGIAGYSKAMMKYRINKTIEQITLIAGNVRTFFAPQGNYSGVQCSCHGISGICESSDEADGCLVVKKAKILPDEVITVNSAGKITSITNPFGENYTVSVASNDNPWGDDDNKAFAVGIYVPSTEACIELLTHDWRNANVSAVKIFQSYEYGSVVPVSVDDAVTACNYSGSILLDFYFDVNINSEYWKVYLQSCAIGTENCV